MNHSICKVKACLALAVAADMHGNVYGAEVGPRQLVKYVRED